MALVETALDFAEEVLAPGGAVVMKVLEGAEFAQLLKDTKRLFREAGATKPAASRDVSREIFIVGTGYIGPARKAESDAPVKTPPP